MDGPITPKGLKDLPTPIVTAAVMQQVLGDVIHLLAVRRPRTEIRDVWRRLERIGARWPG
jgi:hypothetical protein